MATVMGQAPAATGESNEADPRAQTLCECFQATAQRAPDEVALRSAESGAEVTWGQYAARVRGSRAASPRSESRAATPSR